MLDVEGPNFGVDVVIIENNLSRNVPAIVSFWQCMW